MKKEAEKFDPTFLKKWMKEKGYSQKEFAKMCDISLNTLQSILSGISNPRLQTMLKLINAMNVKCIDMFGV